MEQKTEYLQQLIEILLEDPTLTNNEIAKIIGTYRQKVWRDIDKLEREGTLWGFTSIFDENKLGLHHYVMLIKTNPMNEVAGRRIRDRGKNTHEGIRKISTFFTSGDYDIVFAYTANSPTKGRAYFDYLRTAFGDLFSERPTLLNVTYQLRREGKIDPDFHENISKTFHSFE
jgi:DNA-binding Lrp family transcriptional regulator